MPIHGPRITTFPGMIAAGLGRLVNTLWVLPGGPSARQAELSRRFPSAPADEIAIALEFVRTAHGAANQLSRGRNPALSFPQPLERRQGETTFRYDLLIHTSTGSNRPDHPIRVVHESDQALTLEDLTRLARQLAVSEASRIRRDSPGRIPESSRFRGFDIFAAWQE